MADDKKNTTKGHQPSDANVKLDIFTADEIEKLRAEAQQNVDKKAKAAAKAKLLAQFEAEARQKTGLDEDSITLAIDLAPYSDRIMLDGVTYMQGTTVTVRAGVAAVMFEIMGRSWNHQAEIDGKSENFYRRTRGQMVVPTPDGGAGVVSNVLRA